MDTIETKPKMMRMSKSEVLDDQTLNLVKGQRGKPLLSYDGFLYAQNNKTQDSM
jgi:hypothetical protein